MKLPTAEELNKLIEAGWRFKGPAKDVRFPTTFPVTFLPPDDHRRNCAAEFGGVAMVIPHWWTRDEIFEEKPDDNS